ncbi:hypothetical protein [Marivita sp. GX14005]|uniref:hypothetical protein n=1 Tax=Marivita sp. GX14005 TaxID=2942276 RepID=UPI002019545F|nr:hypothetical protein [Marivita sp. GX14005]MCL3881769.1 hypothetical protein [Marivita sp. GX14005]
MRLFASLVVVVALGLSALWLRAPDRLAAEEMAARYQKPLPAPGGPLDVFHLGHSLVGRDMPAMLAQLAGHDHASQLGWGTPLKAHWEDSLPIEGFATENAHPHYRDAREALESGAFDAFVLTEMVEIEAAIEYFEAPDYLERWVGLARAGNTDMRIYLFETWHALDDPQGWLTRLDTDPARYWEGVLLARALANEASGAIHVIPAGRVLAEFVRRIEGIGGLDGVQSRSDLFARLDDGSVDPLHLNDLGAYLIALTHYAVLYHRSPEGLPRQLRRADGTLADAPGPAVASLMQRTAWDVVRELSVTGLP